MITLQHLVKKYGSKTAVDIEQLSITHEGLIGLVGNNGAGKTTLFRLILDLVEPTEGEVCINGKNVALHEDWKATTGAFIDSGFLMDFLTPTEYFNFIGKFNNITEAEVAAHCAHYARFLPEKEDLNATYIRNLSAGNKQKVGIVGALLHHPRLVLLDEPFNFLDPTSQSMLKLLLSEYASTYQAIVFISSHNLNHVADSSERVLLMEKGHILRDMHKADSDIEAELTAYFNVNSAD